MLLQDLPPTGKQASEYTLPDSAFSSTGGQPAVSGAEGNISTRANAAQEIIEGGVSIGSVRLQRMHVKSDLGSSLPPAGEGMHTCNTCFLSALLMQEVFGKCE